MSDTGRVFSRRQFIGGLGTAAALSLVGATVRSAAASTLLPLRTTGLEHVSLWVPDVAAAGKFFGAVFDPFLHKEKDPPLRYYVPLGTGYIALGAAGQRPVQIDHYCALVEDYDPKAMGEALQARGMAAGRFGMIPDPDGIQLQLLGVPGGLAPSTEPAGRIVQSEPLVKPLGLDHVVVRVSDLDRALPFYRTFFGQEASRSASEAWFQIAQTRLGIVQAAAQARPQVDYFCVNVAPFDRGRLVSGLQELGARVESTGAANGALRFSDPDGIAVEVKPAR